MSYWAGKRVLVTGADGFIGSHLVEKLVREGANVRAFVLYNSFNSWGWLENASKEVRSATEVVSGDIRDARFVNMAAHNCEDIFHLAALIAIPYSYQAPESFVQTNVLGTLNVLNAARDHNIQTLVHASTSEVYGTALEIPIRENHPLQAQSPYSASKIAADKLAESYFCSFNLPVAILRPFNTYGPRQSARAVIPTIITQLLSGCSEIKLGSLEPRRDFTYVSDTADGFLLAGQCPDAIGRVTQIGTGKDISVGELLRLIQDVLEMEAVVAVEEKRRRPSGSEVQRLVCDNSQARNLLGWSPAVGLREGIARTAAWIRENLTAYKVNSYNV